MSDVVIYDLSGHLTKGLRQGNSHATSFAGFDVLAIAPGAQAADGWYALSEGGAIAPRRLFLAPYCEGQAGSQFSLRVYGWRGVIYPDANMQVLVSIPFLIAEFLCTASSRAGPSGDNANAPSFRLLRETERMCDTISLTQGTLGLSGYVNSTGPGTDLMAYALIDPGAARSIQFDFQTADTGNDVGMNLFWALA